MCTSGKVELGTLLEVKEKVRPGEEVRVPAAAARKAADVDATAEIVKPDLDAMRLP
jgi:hypothetical protein